jgi:beta-mannosidase
LTSYHYNEFHSHSSCGVVDYYGVPKLSYYVQKSAYEPLHACAIMENLNPGNAAFEAKIFLCDDTDALTKMPWQVTVRAFDETLSLVKQSKFTGTGSINQVACLGEFSLTAKETKNAPFLLVTEVIKDGVVADRAFYWLNFRTKPGFLLTLPRTELKLSFKEGVAIIKNIGAKPAVGVFFDCRAVSDKFVCGDSYFWLDAGEERRIEVNLTENIGVRAFNCNCDKEYLNIPREAVLDHASLAPSKGAATRPATPESKEKHNYFIPNW